MNERMCVSVYARMCVSVSQGLSDSEGGDGGEAEGEGLVTSCRPAHKSHDSTAPRLGRSHINRTLMNPTKSIVFNVANLKDVVLGN